MCKICGVPSYIPCQCDTPEPFCSPCADNLNCPIELDASCVYYNIGGINDSRISKLTCLNLPNGTPISSILEKIDELICNNANVSITPVETFTAKINATGSARHTLSVDVKVSDDENNAVEIRPDGLYVPEIVDTYKVKVDSLDTPDYLDQQVIGSVVNSWLTITVNKVNGKLVIGANVDEDALCEAMLDCRCSEPVTNLVKTFAPACATGYTLNEEGTACVQVLTSIPDISGTVVEACAQYRAEYSAYGAIIYKNGFTGGGTGIGSSLALDLSAGNVIGLTTPNVWASDNLTGDNNGPANRVGIWNCDYTASGTEENPETLGFSIPVEVTTTKTYYIGIAADNDFQITVNGATVVDSSVANELYWPDGDLAKFRYWHIYPIILNAGINYVGLFAKDYGTDALLGAEIYDNTIAQLQSAALNSTFLVNPSIYPLTSNHYSNLNLIFSTRCARQPGATFSIGNATCPDSTWDLDTTGGDPLVSPCQGINGDTGDWVCTKTLTAAFSGYSVTLVWDRINSAVDYDVQQKLTTESDTTYIDTTVSPVDNPNSGNTVSTTINNLPSNDMTFRVRPNYGDCVGPWLDV